MKRKLNPARASRVEYPTLEMARKILLAGVLACGVAHADNSVPPAQKVARPMARANGGPIMVHPPPPGVPPRPLLPPKKVEKDK